MRPAFSYYGGKQKLAPKIIPLIPKHTVYVEPFAGGAAIFFKKPWPNVTDNNHYREVLNDTNGEIANFFQQLRDNGDELARACQLTPYSRGEYEACKIDAIEPLERARRFFVCIQQSFASTYKIGWGTSVSSGNNAATFNNTSDNLFECARRLRGVFVEKLDAIELIKKWDSPQTFFYCDPPYPGAVQGHYKGYTTDDFNNLVAALDECKGSFLLSNYDQPSVPDSWERFDFSVHSSAMKNSDKKTRKRTEVVWRSIRGENLRPELQKVYNSEKLDAYKTFYKIQCKCSEYIINEDLLKRFPKNYKCKHCRQKLRLVKKWY